MAFACARSASRCQLGNAGWVALVIYRHLDGSIYIGCMESARWVTPAESATIVCAGLVIYMSMQELTFPAADPGHGPLGCGKVPLCNSWCIRLGRLGNLHPWQCLVGVGQPHMLALRQTWESASATTQHAVGVGQPHMLAFGQPSASFGFPVPACKWQPL